VKKTLRSICIVALFLLALTLAFSGQVVAESSEESGELFEYIKGEIVVSVEKDSDIASIQGTDEAIRKSTLLKQSGFQVVDSLLDSNQPDSSQAMGNDFKSDVVEKMGLVYLVEYSDAKYKDIDKAKEELEESLKSLGLKVRYIQENYAMHALEAVPEEILPAMHPNQRWHYNMIRVPEAWGITPGSSSTRIAVLDTGIDSNHSSLKNLVNTSLGRSFVGGSTADVQGHGTHVAGTIASYGAVSGVMQNATLIPVKVLNDRGSGSMFGIQQGIIHATSVDSDVINMSLGGGGYDRGMDEAIQTANSRGTIVVAASGNDGIGKVSYPAAYSGSIAVGSVTSNETRSSFSNYGSELDVMAPGSNIYSTIPNNRYVSMSGTSMATPHVAGVVGLMRSANPSLSVTQTRAILNNTAQPAGPSIQYGHGIVDAHAAAQAANGR